MKGFIHFCFLKNANTWTWVERCWRLCTSVKIRHVNYIQTVSVSWCDFWSSLELLHHVDFGTPRKNRVDPSVFKRALSASWVLEVNWNNGLMNGLKLQSPPPYGTKVKLIGQSLRASRDGRSPRLEWRLRARVRVRKSWGCVCEHLCQLRNSGLSFSL